MRLLLFDVDGTLLSARGAGRRAMERAGAATFEQGFPLEGVLFAGQLDAHIFARACERCGVEPDDGAHARFRERYLQELERELAGPEARCELLPGVDTLLGALAEEELFARGLVTGNYRGAAATKLAAAGLDIAAFPHGAFGDEAPSRPGLVSLALERFSEQTGVALDPADVWVIGDTPFDVGCARENGCRALAVATGTYPRAQLEEAGADLLLDDLLDTGRVLEALRGSA